MCVGKSLHVWALSLCGFNVAVGSMDQQEQIRRLVGAVKRDDAIKVEALLQTGVPVNTSLAGVWPDHNPPSPRRSPLWCSPRDWPALHWAAALGHVNPLLALLRGGADVNLHAPDGTDSTPLALAVLEVRLEAVRVLLDHGADPNCCFFPRCYNAIALATTTDGGETTLQMGRLLLERGADPNLGPALWSAAGKRDGVHLVQLLLDYGAVINQPEGHRAETALARAAIYGLENIVRVLLEAGANPNARDRRGRTVLMVARKRPTNILRLLLQHGADPSLTDNEGATALDYAQGNDRTEAVELLRTAGECLT